MGVFEEQGMTVDPRDSPRALQHNLQPLSAAPPAGDNARLRASSDKPLEPKVLQVVRESEATWQQSSFDLAQGLDIKVMKSKHSVETLDRLFGRC
jgi:hypothetical protein